MGGTDEGSRPILDAYNILKCEPGKILSFPTQTSTQNGFIIKMDFKPIRARTAGGVYNIMSLRDSMSNVIYGRLQIAESTSLISFSIIESEVNTVTHPNALTPGNSSLF